MKKQNKQTTHRFRLRIIFFSVLIFAIIVAIIKPLPIFPYHLDFKITKETCSEKINYDFSFACYHGCEYQEESKYKNISFDSLNALDKFTTECRERCLGSASEDVCEQVEVDEIIFDFDEDYLINELCNEVVNGCSVIVTSKDYYSDENTTSNSIKEFNVSIMPKNKDTGFWIKAQKEDLTIDWLDKNADECLIDETYWVSTQNFGIFAEGECSKYKLRDYTIEVLN